MIIKTNIRICLKLSWKYSKISSSMVFFVGMLDIKMLCKKKTEGEVVSIKNSTNSWNTSLPFGQLQ